MTGLVKSLSLSLGADSSAVYTAHREPYVAQLVAPMDDMWAAFSDGGAHHALLVEGEEAGSCSVDAEARLLRFFVLPAFLQHSEALLRLTIRELGVDHMMASTVDPTFLSSALDVASKVESHTLMFAPTVEAQVPGLEGLTVAEMGDHGRIVDFQVAALGAPREFLDPYSRGRLESRELILFEEGSRIVCVGELRPDVQQPGVAQVGVIVHQEERGRGVASQMLSSLVQRSRADGLRPYCSTEKENVGARRAIERAGFRAHHRILRIEHGS